MKSVYLGAIYLSLAASIWGGMYVASKYVLDIVPPFTLVFFRYLLAGMVLVLICRAKKISLIEIKDKGLILQIGFIGYFLSIGAQFIGTKLSSAHMGAVITTLSPIFQSGFAILLLKEKLAFKQFLSILISFVGVLVIIGLSGGVGEDSSFAGNLFLLAAALFWGYYSVLAKKASGNYSALQITTWAILIATVITLPVAISESSFWNFADLFNWKVILGIFYVAILATAVAFFCWNKGLSMVPSHQAGLFFFFQPIVGSILGCLILGERLTWSFYIGSILILSGVYYNMINNREVEEVSSRGFHVEK